MNLVLSKVTFALKAMVLVFASTHFCYSDSAVAEIQRGWNAAAIGRKTVTVYADNEASASAQATKQNPGWTVESVKKVSKDPKSRAYQVTLSN